MAGLEKSEEGRVIVRAILGLAKGFGLETTAEGIKEPAQLAYLKAHGCTEGQGYLFSKAVPAEAIPVLIGLSQFNAVISRGSALASRQTGVANPRIRRELA